MVRRLTVLILVAAFAAGCGGGGSGSSGSAFPRKFEESGPLMGGFKAYLQSDKEEYVEGQVIRLKCALLNKSPREVHLDSTADWALATLEVEKVGGDKVPTVSKGAKVRREYLRVAPGKPIFWVIENLETKLWSVKKPLEPGTYRITLVYDGSRAKASEAWDRLSSAGGKYEGGELWTATVRSNPVTITVKSMTEALKKK